MSETKVEMKIEEEIKPIKELCDKLVKMATAELEKNPQEVDTHEMGEVVDMIKDLSKSKNEVVDSCYKMQIAGAMEKHEDEYDENGRMFYQGQPRSKTSGRFMSRNDGRRNYDEPQDYQMDMAMHRMASEDMRDLDHRKGVHYYTDGGVNVSENMTPQSREMFRGNNSSGGSTRLDRARKMYEEKQDAKSFEEYLEAMKEELIKHKNTMDETQKNMAKQKLVNMTNSL